MNFGCETHGAFACLFVVGLLAACHCASNRSVEYEAYYADARGGQKLIVILADGIRHDYLNEPDLGAFARMRREGVHAEYVEPIFPANSYPNWYTIVTGNDAVGASRSVARNSLLS